MHVLRWNSGRESHLGYECWHCYILSKQKHTGIFSKGFSDTTSVLFAPLPCHLLRFCHGSFLWFERRHNRINDKYIFPSLRNEYATLYIYLAKFDCLCRNFLNWYTHTSEGWDDYGGEAKHLGRVFPRCSNAPPIHTSNPSRATEARPRRRMRVIRTHQLCTRTRLFIRSSQTESDHKRYATPMLKRQQGKTSFSCPSSPRATFKSIRWWMPRRRSRTTGLSVSAAPTRPWRRSCA